METKNALFDIGLIIPPQYKVLKPGGELVTSINLSEIARVGVLDVTVNYIIKDTKNNTILLESETFAVDGQKQYIKKFKLPENISLGQYVVAAEIIYESGVAISSSLFEITELKPKNTLESTMLLLSLMFILLGVVYFLVKVSFSWKNQRKKNKRRYKSDSEN